jgi:peptidoglycan/LPS O-acetylase OafA/YrhL
VVLVGSGLLREVVNIKFPLENTDLNVWNAWCYCFFPSTVLFFLLGHLSRQLYKVLPMSRATGFAGIGIAFPTCLIQDATYNFENVNVYFSILVFATSLPAVFAATKDNAACNFLGDLTYPLYLTHGLLLVALAGSWRLFHEVTDAILAVSNSVGSSMLARGVTALALLTSVVTRFVIEKPATYAMRAVLARCGGLTRLASPVPASPPP